MAYDFSALITGIEDTETHLAHELANIRTGRATPTLLDGVKPEAYGTRAPLTQIASVSIEDARTLRVIVWDKDLSKAIEKAIIDADLGVSVSVDDQGVRVAFPELTAERRTLLAKLVGEKFEHAKVTVRNHRTDAVRALDAQEKEGGMGKDELFRLKEEAQKLVDAGIERLEKIAEKKRAEIAQ
ncbi:MAG TPA: ribosome recycling factor [Candidatus Paceibacterota bacterium]|nr:ribosome recycling factor [Candidatus Paceibacterota bacterium]